MLQVTKLCDILVLNFTQRSSVCYYNTFTSQQTATLFPSKDNHWFFKQRKLFKILKIWLNSVNRKTVSEDASERRSDFMGEGVRYKWYESGEVKTLDFSVCQLLLDYGSVVWTTTYPTTYPTTYLTTYPTTYPHHLPHHLPPPPAKHIRNIDRIQLPIRAIV